MVGGRYENLSKDLAPLWRAIHDRLSSGRAVSRVKIGPLDLGQQTALADLLGLARLPGEYATVSLPRIDEVLIESVGVDTHAVGHALGIAGGAVYDALLAAAAGEHGITLATRDRRAADTYGAPTLTLS